MKKTILLIATFLLFLTSIDAMAAKTLHDLKRELNINEQDKESMCILSDFLIDISESTNYDFVKEHMDAVSSLKATYLCEGHSRDDQDRLIDPEYSEKAYQKYCTYGEIADKKILISFEDPVTNSLIVSRGFDKTYITYLINNSGFALLTRSKPKIPPSSLTHYLKIDGCVAKRYKVDGSEFNLFQTDTLPVFLRSTK